MFALQGFERSTVDSVETSSLVSCHPCTVQELGHALLSLFRLHIDFTALRKESPLFDWLHRMHSGMLFC